jgi:hypothetical protein
VEINRNRVEGEKKTADEVTSEVLEMLLNLISKRSAELVRSTIVSRVLTPIESMDQATAEMLDAAGLLHVMHLRQQTNIYCISPWCSY